MQSIALPELAAEHVQFTSDVGHELSEPSWQRMGGAYSNSSLCNQLEQRWGECRILPQLSKQLLKAI